MPNPTPFKQLIQQALLKAGPAIDEGLGHARINASFERGGVPAIGEHAPAPDVIPQLGKAERGSSLPLVESKVAAAEHVTPPADSVGEAPGKLRDTRVFKASAPIEDRAFSQETARDADPAEFKQTRTNTDLSDRPPVPIRDSGEHPNDFVDNATIEDLKHHEADLSVRMHALLGGLPEDHVPSDGLQRLIDQHLQVQGRIRGMESGVRDKGVAEIADAPGFRQDLYNERMRSKSNESYYARLPEITPGDQADINAGYRRSPNDQFRQDNGEPKRYRYQQNEEQRGNGQSDPHSMVPDPEGDRGLVEPFKRQVPRGMRDVTKPQVSSTGALKTADVNLRGVEDTRARLQPPEAVLDERGRPVKDSRGKPVQSWDTYDPTDLAERIKAGDPRALLAYKTAVSDSVGSGFEKDVERRAGTIYDRTHDPRDPLTSRMANQPPTPDLESIAEDGQHYRGTASRIGSADAAPSSNVRGGAFSHLDDLPADQYGNELGEEKMRDRWRSRESSQSVGSPAQEAADGEFVGKGALQGTRSGRELPTLQEFASDNGIDNLEDIPASVRSEYKARYGEGSDQARRNEGSGMAGTAMREAGHASIDSENAQLELGAANRLQKWVRDSVKSGAITQQEADALLNDGKSLAEVSQRAASKADLAQTRAPGVAQRMSTPAEQVAPSKSTPPGAAKRAPNTAGEAAYAKTEAARRETQAALDKVTKASQSNSRWTQRRSS